VFVVPAATPEVVAMLTSGLTASIGLEQVIKQLHDLRFLGVMV
jgi:hypothetical protein